MWVRLLTPPSRSATGAAERSGYLYGVGRESLKRDEHRRYLGVSLDPGLCLRHHIKEWPIACEKGRFYRSWRGQNGVPHPSP
ncbi:hypothetical protein PoB_006717500 [Plakobranchus ocellatus]|uniref:Uncharacterized protein n=1 Tax=Plakobranchus ocellatus TaxID=259542 RepID=A0AAV4D9D5_9GAST|nr:hypothetical protein PoB_006717500 [Plakobranchus ocellatus]